MVCCSFIDIENNFGIANDGVLYAVYAYQANRKDELSFECGERLTVVRRGDVNEKEWWWARDTRKQYGYIPRNLLGVSFYFGNFYCLVSCEKKFTYKGKFMFSLSLLFFFAFSYILR